MNKDFFKISTKVLAIIASILTIYDVGRGIIGADKSLHDIFLSPIAYIIYGLLLFILLFIVIDKTLGHVLNENSSLKEQNGVLSSQIAELKQALNTALQAGKIATFKNKYFLSTEKLYLDLADQIHNNIEIFSLDINNTIEKKGSRNKKYSRVTLTIKGRIIEEEARHFELLVAGDSIIKWQDISFHAYDVVNGSSRNLIANLDDKGQDSYLKQMVISYSDKKKKNDFIELVISWIWPNMLSITDDDYVTLPIVFSPYIHRISMSLTPKMSLDFEEIGVYKYSIGKSEVEFLSNLESRGGEVLFTDDSPEYKTCYLLYYKIINDKENS